MSVFTIFCVKQEMLDTYLQVLLTVTAAVDILFQVIGGVLLIKMRVDLQGLTKVGRNRYSFEASSIRVQCMDYFNSPEGQVSWQLNHVKIVV